MMRRALQVDPWIAILAVLTASLVLRLVLALLAPAAVPEQTTAGQSDPNDAIAAISELPLEPIAAYDAVSQRPLFAPDRRPFVAPPVAIASIAPAAPTTPPPTDLRLSAIVTVGGKQIALIQRGGASNTERVAIGTSIAGWQVIAIDAESVTLEQGGAHHTLHLATSGPPTGLPR